MNRRTLNLPFIEGYGFDHELFRETDNVKFRVALFDTGTNVRDRRIAVRDFTGEGVDDLNGHGTATTTLLLSLFPSAKVLHLKVMEEDGRGPLISILEALSYVLKRRVDVIAMPLTLRESPVLKKACKKVDFLVAAGGYHYSDRIPYPARHRNVLSVGAITLRNELIPYKVLADVYAPGSFLLPDNEGRERVFTGTSMATVVVAGLIGVSRRLSGAPWGEVRKALLGSSTRRSLSAYLNG